jgi:hypothetical protein
MKEKFVAYYEGKAIGKSGNFQELMAKKRVQALLGRKELIIRHITSEGAKVVYRGA